MLIWTCLFVILGWVTAVKLLQWNIVQKATAGTQTTILTVVPGCLLSMPPSEPAITALWSSIFCFSSSCKPLTKQDELFHSTVETSLHKTFNPWQISLLCHFVRPSQTKLLFETQSVDTSMNSAKKNVLCSLPLAQCATEAGNSGQASFLSGYQLLTNPFITKLILVIWVAGAAVFARDFWLLWTPAFVPQEKNPSRSPNRPLPLVPPGRCCGLTSVF